MANIVRAYIALALLFLIGLTNYFDRVALGILQVPIKEELGFSDSQLGLLTGLAFFIPYTLLAIPVARLADRYNRLYLLAAALVVWSGMTAMISIADAFLFILVLRMGVAIGEACCLPTCYSLISDYFPPAKRGRAISIFVAAFPLGSMLGIAGAAALSDLFGWRVAFAVLGGIGLALAPLLLLLLREPPRGAFTEKTESTKDQKPLPLKEALLLLWGRRELRYLAVGIGFQTYVVSTVLAWSAPFYVRIHDVQLSHAALVLGLLTGIGGALGSFLGGTLADRFGKGNQRWYLWVPAVICIVTAITGMLQFLLPTLIASFVFGAITLVMTTAFVPPLYAIAQSIVAPNMRALTSALLVMASSLLGGAFGPSVTGSLSDLFNLLFGTGPDSIRGAIVVGFLFSLGGGWFFFRAGKVLDPVPLEEYGTAAVKG